MNRLLVAASGIFVGLLLLISALFWSGVQGTDARIAAEQWESHTRDVLIEAQQLLAALEDVETGQRGYIITGLSDFLEPYEAGQQAAGESIDRLAALTIDNASQQGRIQQLRGVMAARIAFAAETISLIRAGDLQGAVAIVKTRRGKVLMDDARVLLAAIAAEERRLLTIRHGTVEESAERDRDFVYELAGIGLLTLVAAGIAVSLAIRAREKAKLSDEATRFSEQRYHSLLERTPASIAMFDMEMRYLVASQRYLFDYRISTNTEFNGLIGRCYYDVFPDVPRHWHDIHQRVLSGESIAVDDDPFPRDDGTVDWVRWDMSPWHHADGTIGGAVLCSEVVTVDKQARIRNEFLLQLASRLHNPPAATLADAAEMLARHLNVSQVAFIEPNAAEKPAKEQADNGFAGSASIDPLTDFGPEAAAELRAGTTLVIVDIETDPRARAAAAAQLGAESRALLAVPLIRQGQMLAILLVCDRDPRKWPRHEVQLAEDVAARAWEAVAQARVTQALEQTAGEFTTLAEGIPTLCWMAEADGHIYWYNQRWYDYTGTTNADMEGWGWQTVHDPDVLPGVMERWQTSIATGAPFEMTFPLRAADGSFRPFLTRVAPVYAADGKVWRWLGTNVDVTEATEREAALEQSSAALRESEARLQVIFDTAPVGIVIGEAPSGRIIAANRFSETLFRHPVLYSPGIEHYRDWVAFHRDGRRVESGEFPLARALAGEERPEIEVLYQRGDGELAWLRLIAAPIKADGRVTGAVVVAIDIDQEIRANEALARARDELENRVIEEVQGREAAQSRLAQAEKLTALGQLAGGVAHDFNNVMQSISGGTSLIDRHAHEPAKVKRLAAMVQDAARRGASVTSRLLAFARKGELRAEPVNLAVLLNGLREILVHTLGASVSVRMELAPELPAVLADRGQLETVLVNLATNARDAMPAGGTITFSTTCEVIESGQYQEGSPPGAISGLSSSTPEPAWTRKP